jgi:ribosome-associated protein
MEYLSCSILYGVCKIVSYSKQGVSQKVEALVKDIEVVLDSGKAEDIVVINLAGKADFADYMVVASGTSQRHVSALSEHVEKFMSEHHQPILSVEGKPGCDWVLVDCGDVIVHLFRPEMRGAYNLEKMWSVPAMDAASSGFSSIFSEENAERVASLMSTSA